eukprot:593400-Prorocentrum_minimum.AAC.1
MACARGEFAGAVGEFAGAGSEIAGAGSEIAGAGSEFTEAGSEFTEAGSEFIAPFLTDPLPLSLGQGVVIGPFCTVGAEVVLGDRCKLVRANPL